MLRNKPNKLMARARKLGIERFNAAFRTDYREPHPRIREEFITRAYCELKKDER